MLSDTAARNAKPREKPYKVSDGRGLFLLVTPTGGKRWRFKYRVDGKEKLLALGTYPDVGVKEARERVNAARSLLANGTDPGEHRKAEKQASRLQKENTFRALAEAWYSKKEPTWAPSTAQKTRLYLDRDLLPALGERPIGEIRRPELVETLRRFEDRDAHNVAKKARQWLSGVFRFALVTGVIEVNPTTDLEVVSAPAPRSRRHAHLQAKELPGFLKALQGYGGEPATGAAIQLLLMTAVRPGELRLARWEEFDLDTATWQIPAARMKMRRPHTVPLPDQAVAILRNLRKRTASSPLVFPSRDDSTAPMSENTLNAAIKRLGYKGRQTGHGFRHLVSTALNELGYKGDWIERQLAHGDADPVRDVYNGAEYLEPRRKMMQEWANHIDSLRRGKRGADKMAELVRMYGLKYAEERRQDRLANESLDRGLQDRMAARDQEAQHDTAQQSIATDKSRKMDRGHQDRGLNVAPTANNEIQLSGHSLRTPQTLRQNLIVSPDTVLETDREEYERQVRTVTAEWRNKLAGVPLGDHPAAQNACKAINEEREAKLAKLENEWKEKYGSLPDQRRSTGKAVNDSKPEVNPRPTLAQGPR